MALSFRVVAMALLAIVIVIFAVQNVVPVDIHVFNFSYALPLAIVITGAAAAGGLLVGLLALIRQVGMKSKIRNQETRADQAEAQLKETEEREQSLAGEVAAMRARLAAVEAELAQLRTGVPPGAAGDSTAVGESQSS